MSIDAHNLRGSPTLMTLSVCVSSSCQGSPGTNLIGNTLHRLPYHSVLQDLAPIQPPRLSFHHLYLLIMPTTTPCSLGMESYHPSPSHSTCLILQISVLWLIIPYMSTSHIEAIQESMSCSSFYFQHSAYHT